MSLFETIQLLVTPSTSKTIVLSMKPNDTVAMLRQQIHDRISPPNSRVESIRLVFANKELQEDKNHMTLTSVGIEDQSVIVPLFRLNGGI